MYFPCEIRFILVLKVTIFRCSREAFDFSYASHRNAAGLLEWEPAITGNLNWAPEGAALELRVGSWRTTPKPLHIGPDLVPVLLERPSVLEPKVRIEGPLRDDDRPGGRVSVDGTAGASAGHITFHNTCSGHAQVGGLWDADYIVRISLVAAASVLLQCMVKSVDLATFMPLEPSYTTMHVTLRFFLEPALGMNSKALHARLKELIPFPFRAALV